VLAPADIAGAIRKVHDFLTVGAAAPLQQAGTVALASSPEYYRELAEHYRQRRDLLLHGLEGAGLRPWTPEGAYYILCDIAAFGFENDVAFVQHMIERAGVAAVPGSSFFNDPANGSHLIRFCFCKREETILEAARRLKQLRA
jgi:aminotransferase